MVTETWLDGVTVVHQFDYTFDAAGQLLTAGDDAADYAYDYDDLGRAIEITHDITGLTAQIVMAQAFDAVGNRVQLSASIGGTDDFVTDFAYDDLYRMTRIEQQGQSGGNAVAEKRIDLAYDAASQRDTITRYADLAGTDLVATSTFDHDDAGRLTGLTHAKGLTTLADYAWQYDQASWVSQFVSAADGTSDYGYDDRGQVTEADHDYQSDEAYSFDENGNRTNAGYVTGDHNRLLSDGTYNYEYDNEGNRTRRTHIVNDTVTVYAWDHRNRQVKITDYASTADADAETNPTQVVEHARETGTGPVFRFVVAFLGVRVSVT